MIYRLKFQDSLLTVKAPNKVLLLKNGNIIEITKMFCVDKSLDVNKVIISGKKIKIIESDIHYPDDLKFLNIFKVPSDTTNDEIETVLAEIDKKMILISIYQLSDDEK